MIECGGSAGNIRQDPAESGRQCGAAGLNWPGCVYNIAAAPVADGLTPLAASCSCDPVFGVRHFRQDSLNAELSGRFLVATPAIPAGWRMLTVEEMGATVGRSGWFAGYPGEVETICERCDQCPLGVGGSGGPGASGGMVGGNPGRRGMNDELNGPGSGSSCYSGACMWTDGSVGIPSWRVTEPKINVWLQDTPLVCQPAYGPAVGFQLRYKQRDEVAGSITDVSTVGPLWNCRWLSWADNYYYARYGVLRNVDLCLPGGGKLAFVFESGQAVATEYHYNARLTASLDGGGVPVGFTLDYPDGRQLVYDQVWKTRYFT